MSCAVARVGSVGVWLGMLALAGCQHRAPLSRDALLDVATRYQRDQRAEVDAPKEQQPPQKKGAPAPSVKRVMITEAHAPELFVVLKDAPEGKRRSYLVPLRRVRLRADNTLSLGVPTSMILDRWTRVEVDVAQVQTAELRYEDARDASWTPSFAFGVMMLGPGGVAGYHAHVFPADWFVFDMTIFGAPHMFNASFGVRARPVRLGNVSPFLGAGIGFAWFGGTGEEYGPDGEVSVVEVTTSVPRMGFRGGVDVELWRRRVLLGVELDYMYSAGEEQFLFYPAQAWGFGGGLYVAYISG